MYNNSFRWGFSVLISMPFKHILVLHIHHDVGNHRIPNEKKSKKSNLHKRYAIAQRDKLWRNRIIFNNLHYILKWHSIKCFIFSGIILYFIFWNLHSFRRTSFMFGSTQKSYLLLMLKKVDDYHNHNFGKSLII